MNAITNSNYVNYIPVSVSVSSCFIGSRLGLMTPLTAAAYDFGTRYLSAKVARGGQVATVARKECLAKGEVELRLFLQGEVELRLFLRGKNVSRRGEVELQLLRGNIFSRRGEVE